MAKKNMRSFRREMTAMSAKKAGTTKKNEKIDFGGWLDKAGSKAGAKDFIGVVVKSGGTKEDAEQQMSEFFEFLDDREVFFECYPNFSGQV